MKIDLSNVGNGHELSPYEMTILKTSHLHKGLAKTNENLGTKFNFLIVSMFVYNLIIDHHMFKSISKDSSIIDGPYYVGKFGIFECYVDLLMSPNELIMSYDRQIIRDNKIDNILNGVESINRVKVNINGLN